MKLKCLLILPLLVASLQAASVDDLTFTLNGDGNGYSVTDCLTSASGSLDIPSFYNGLPVTSIDKRSFEKCTSLTSITIPNGVTSIGRNAFEDCISLSSVTIPDSVTSIGTDAFENCNSLNSITIPNGVTSIGSYAFKDCTTLASITIPDSVNSIEIFAFTGCSGLTRVTIPDGMTRIGWNAFQGCTNLSSVTFNGDAPHTIGQNLFGNNDSVTVYYYDDATGFTSPTWQEIQTEEISRPVPIIADIEKLEDGVNLRFNSAIGESYRIESSNNLENWTMLEEQILASSELIERLYSTDDYSRRFFRVIHTNVETTLEFTFIGTNNQNFSAYYGDEAIISAANIPLYETGSDKYYLASYQVIEWSSNTPIGGSQYGRPKVTVATTSSLVGHNLLIRFFKYDSSNANNFSSSGPILTIDGDALAQQEQTVQSASGIVVSSQLGYSVRVWKEAKP